MLLGRSGRSLLRRSCSKDSNASSKSFVENDGRKTGTPPSDRFSFEGFQGLHGLHGFHGLQGSQGFRGFRGLGGRGFRGGQGLRGSRVFRGSRGARGLEGLEALEVSGTSRGSGARGSQGPRASPGLGDLRGLRVLRFLGSQAHQGFRVPQPSQGSHGLQRYQGSQEFQRSTKGHGPDKPRHRAQAPPSPGPTPAFHTLLQLRRLAMELTLCRRRRCKIQSRITASFDFSPRRSSQTVQLPLTYRCLERHSWHPATVFTSAEQLECKVCGQICCKPCPLRWAAPRSVT